MTESTSAAKPAKPARAWDKRNITAIVVSTVVAVAMSAGASAAISKVSEQIKIKIAPPVNESE